MQLPMTPMTPASGCGDWLLTCLLVQAVHAIGADILHIQDAAGTYGFENISPAAASESDRWRGKIVITVHEYGWWEASRPRWWNG